MERATARPSWGRGPATLAAPSPLTASACCASPRPAAPPSNSRASASGRSCRFVALPRCSAGLRRNTCLGVRSLDEAGTSTSAVRHPLTRPEYVYQGMFPSMAISHLVAPRGSDSDLCTATLTPSSAANSTPLGISPTCPACRRRGGGEGPRGCRSRPPAAGGGALFYENLSIGLPPLLRAYGHSGNVFAASREPVACEVLRRSVPGSNLPARRRVACAASQGVRARL